MALDLNSHLQPSQLNVDGLHADISTTLILAPHPDDESLGCGGLIKLLSEQGTKVFIAFITDGSHSHPNSRKFPPHLLASMRMEEAINACAILGIPSSQLIFLYQPDGYLSEIGSDIFSDTAQLITTLINHESIQSLFLPFENDHHADHRATWRIGLKAVEDSVIKPQIIEYPVWLWHHGVLNDLPDSKLYDFYKLDIAGVKEVKLRAILAHKTQTTTMINDDPTGFVLTSELIAPFLEGYEYFFFRKIEKIPTLRKSYFDQLYTRDQDPWNFESSTYEIEKYHKSLYFLKPTYTNVLEVGCSIGVFTNLLADRTKKLLAIDISELPLVQASKNCSSHSQVRFKKMDVTIEFPNDFFDLITLSEVGYYLSKEDLLQLYKRCESQLISGGQLLMVHWTSHVREYPLTGKEVHKIFELEFEDSEKFELLDEYHHELYELKLWSKR